MAQAAHILPLPDSGTSGTHEEAWIHDLTPTLSDASMFDDEGVVQPLGVLPALPSVRRVRVPLRLVPGTESDRATRGRSRRRLYGR